MRILVVSDSHGNQDNLHKARELAGQIDAIVHLGDGEDDAAILAAVEDVPVLQVAGNCDYGSLSPRERLETLAETRLLLCHGDRYGVKLGLAQLIERARSCDATVVLYGHTHQAMVEYYDGIWLINPGTLWGRAPFLSYALLELSPDDVSAVIHKLPE
ncbi:MAG: metallophosphoesterase [Geobacter sp.]|jgi:hypothetical protein|nr:metallophosphoesterase [Geobacter sp.]